MNSVVPRVCGEDYIYLTVYVQLNRDKFVFSCDVVEVQDETLVILGNFVTESEIFLIRLSSCKDS